MDKSKYQSWEKYCKETGVDRMCTSSYAFWKKNVHHKKCNKPKKCKPVSPPNHCPDECPDKCPDEPIAQKLGTWRSSGRDLSNRSFDPESSKKLTVESATKLVQLASAPVGSLPGSGVNTLTSVTLDEKRIYSTTYSVYNVEGQQIGAGGYLAAWTRPDVGDGEMKVAWRRDVADYSGVPGDYSRVAPTVGELPNGRTALFFGSSLIRPQSAVLEEEPEQQFSLFGVPLQGTGKRPRLFCVDASNGDLIWMTEMGKQARFLNDPDNWVYFSAPPVFFHTEAFGKGTSTPVLAVGTSSGSSFAPWFMNLLGQGRSPASAGTLGLAVPTDVGSLYLVSALDGTILGQQRAGPEPPQVGQPIDSSFIRPGQDGVKLRRVWNSLEVYSPEGIPEPRWFPNGLDQPAVSRNVYIVLTGDQSLINYQRSSLNRTSYAAGKGLTLPGEFKEGGRRGAYYYDTVPEFLDNVTVLVKPDAQQRQLVAGESVIPGSELDSHVVCFDVEVQPGNLGTFKLLSVKDGQLPEGVSDVEWPVDLLDGLRLENLLREGDIICDQQDRDELFQRGASSWGTMPAVSVDKETGLAQTVYWTTGQSHTIVYDDECLIYPDAESVKELSFLPRQQRIANAQIKYDSERTLENFNAVREAEAFDDDEIQRQLEVVRSGASPRRKQFHFDSVLATSVALGSFGQLLWTYNTQAIDNWNYGMRLDILTNEQSIPGSGFWKQLALTDPQCVAEGSLGPDADVGEGPSLITAEENGTNNDMLIAHTKYAVKHGLKLVDDAPFYLPVYRVRTSPASYLGPSWGSAATGQLHSALQMNQSLTSCLTNFVPTVPLDEFVAGTPWLNTPPLLNWYPIESNSNGQYLRWEHGRSFVSTTDAMTGAVKWEKLTSPLSTDPDLATWRGHVSTNGQLLAVPAPSASGTGGELWLLSMETGDLVKSFVTELGTSAPAFASDKLWMLSGRGDLGSRAGPGGEQCGAGGTPAYFVKVFGLPEAE